MARSRLDALLARHHPTITIIELGGNDGLRGGSVAAMRANLDAMTTTAQKSGSRVLLVGMRVPPNYGAGYTREFAAAFADVARARKAVLVPFFFAGFAEDTRSSRPIASIRPRLRRSSCSTMSGRSCRRCWDGR